MALRQSLRDLGHEWRTFAGAYPPFVTRAEGQLEAGEIPVFVFHSIEPALFERQLAFLRDNGYETLSAARFVSLLAAGGGNGRQVLLTIDDARSSTWRYAVPLLARYQCRATSFVIPGWTPDSGAAVRPSLTEVWAGTASADEVAALDPEDLSVCTWAELRAMHASDTIDIQSHTFSHRRAFVPSPLRGIFTGGVRCAPFDLPYSPYLTATTRFGSVRESDYFGLPLFESRSILGGEALWRLRGEVIERCRELHRTNGSHGARAGDALRQRIAALVDEHSWEQVPAHEVEAQIDSEVLRARELISTQLGVAADYVCLPFGEGTDAVVARLRALGVQAVFWSARPGRASNRPGDDPGGIVRIKNDFLWRLPGKGRRSLARIYADKIRRRLRGEVPY